MSLPRVKRLLVVMAVVDLLVFGGWIAHEQRARAGARIELPIYGYDPRDLLSGHYVQFHLVAEREAEALGLELGVVSVCLERGSDGRHHVTHARAPDEVCTFLAGTREPHRVDFGVDRFYVDERRANEVERVNEGLSTYLVVTIDTSGVAHPIELVVGGKSLAATR